MTLDDITTATQVGLLENLRNGVTTVVQHHKIVSSAKHQDACIVAASDIGIRMVFVRGWRDIGTTQDSAAAAVRDVERLRDVVADTAGRIRLGFGPMVPRRCSDQGMRITLAAARKWGLPTHMHVAETTRENLAIRRRTGKDVITWLRSLDALGSDFELVHCVHLSDYDLDTIFTSGAMIVHCPVSNLSLASGTAPIVEAARRGIRIGIGTDGVASGGNQDLLANLRAVVLTAKTRTGNPATLTSDAVIRFGLRPDSLNSGSRIGLMPGAPADITLFNLDSVRGLTALSSDSIKNLLLYGLSVSDVATVIVGGRVLLEEGVVRTVDERDIIRRARLASERLVGFVASEATAHVGQRRSHD